MTSDELPEIEERNDSRYLLVVLNIHFELCNKERAESLWSIALPSFLDAVNKRVTSVLPLSVDEDSEDTGTEDTWGRAHATGHVAMHVDVTPETEQYVREELAAYAQRSLEQAREGGYPGGRTLAAGYPRCIVTVSSVTPLES